MWLIDGVNCRGFPGPDKPLASQQIDSAIRNNGLAMDKLNAMRVFTQVIDEAGFAAAARRLNLSPPAVTRLVAELEEHLGTRLINRTTRRIALTDAGAAYLERARQILLDVAEAEAQANLVDGRSGRSPARAGATCVRRPPAGQAPAGVPRPVPAVTIELVVPGPVETVDEGFDLSIIMVARGGLDGDFVARRLARTEVVLCASPDYLDRRGRPLLAARPRRSRHDDPALPAPDGIRSRSGRRRGGGG